jgi:hypothetical protein
MQWDAELTVLKLCEAMCGEFAAFILPQGSCM